MKCLSIQNYLFYYVLMNPFTLLFFSFVWNVRFFLLRCEAATEWVYVCMWCVHSLVLTFMQKCELDLCTLNLCHCQSQFSADTMKSGRVFIVCTGFLSRSLWLIFCTAVCVMCVKWSLFYCQWGKYVSLLTEFHSSFTLFLHNSYSKHFNFHIAIV